MCVNCSATKKKYWVFGCGTVFLLAALLIALLWPSLAQRILQRVTTQRFHNLKWNKIQRLTFSQNLELKEGSLNYNKWLSTPIPMYLKITMFNWTNPEQITNPNVKPHFVEVGPYVFLERHDRNSIQWNPNNNTVSYYQTRVWHFVPEKSNGSLSDKITNINVMTSVSFYDEIRFFSSIEAKMIHDYLPFVTGCRV